MRKGQTAPKGMDGYVRVSRVAGRSGETFISPAVQRSQIEKWAALREIPILSWHTDLDQSGAKQSRPALDEALRRVETGASGGIVVAKLDRFARSLTAALEGIKRILDAGGQFTSVAEGIDPTTPAGKLQQNIMLVFAEFELDRIRESWAVAQQRAVARGVHIASKTPTGYVRDEETGRLVPHPRDAEAIAELFAMRARGATWGELARFLNQHGVEGPYRQELWTQRSMSHILSNPVYLGEARSGAYINPDAHQALVDRVTWEAAQRTNPAPAARGNEPALLAGLLRCAGCRYLMKPDRQTMRDGQRVRIYRCRGEHSAGRCRERAAVLGSIIEPWVVEQFLGSLRSFKATPISEDLADAVRAVDEAEAELVAYRDSERIAAALDEDMFVDGIQVRAAALDEARDRLIAARARAKPASLPDAVTLEQVWPELETAERQRLLRAGLDCVFLRSVGQANVPIADRALIYASGQAPAELPRRGHRVPLAPFAWPDVPQPA